MNFDCVRQVYGKLNGWLKSQDLNAIQKDAVNAAIKALANGERKILLELPVGIGRSAIIFELLWFLLEKQVVHSALVLASNQNILQQFSGTIKTRIYGDFDNDREIRIFHNVSFSTYKDFVNNRDLKNHDVIICLDLIHTSNPALIDLFHSLELDGNTCFIGVKDSGINTDGIFSGILPAFKLSLKDAIMSDERSFITDFLQNLFIHLGYWNIELTPAMGQSENIARLDMIVKTEEGNFYIEAKTYRNQFISQINIEGAVRQILSHSPQIEPNKNILAVTCEIDEEIKANIYETTGVVVWDIGNLVYLCNGHEELVKNLAKQVYYPIEKIKPTPTSFVRIIKNSSRIFIDYNKKKAELLKERLRQCETGKAKKADKEYEHICTEIISFLFYEEFTKFSTQHITDDQIFHMDLLCGLKGSTAFWEFLIKFYHTKFVVFEFKNYAAKLSQNLIYITEKYLFHAALRNVAIIISRKGFQKNAKTAALGSLKEHGKLILDITDADLSNMIDMKLDGREPSDYLLDKAEELLMSVGK